MNVEDMMTTNVVTVRPADTIQEVCAAFRSHHISGLPVVDEYYRVVGIITERDVLGFVASAMSSNSSKLAYFQLIDMLSGNKSKERNKLLDTLRNTKVSEMMTSNVITIMPEHPMENAAKLMIEHKINRLPVVKWGKLVGIVTRRDLVWGKWREK